MAYGDVILAEPSVTSYFPMVEEELPLANLAGVTVDPLDEIGSGPTLGAAPLLEGLGTSVLFDGAQTLHAAGSPFAVNWDGLGEKLGTIEVLFALEDLPSSSLRFLATLWTPDTTTEDYGWFEIDSAGEIVWRRGGSNSAAVGEVAADGQPHHLVAALGVDGMRTYFDGEPAGTHAHVDVTGFATVGVRLRGDTGCEFRIGHLSTYGAELDAAAVARHYRAALGLEMVEFWGARV